ncbi:hypothetical protein C1H46_006711 [Malus baccata]|uniref:PGG domain-containing protein n=1 Tax=Malus baccata TaxID=106549 RepID=A0A540N9Q7_MALBA|nr:hypothetical protein C1H46_006711 [Malus baccata]
MDFVMRGDWDAAMELLKRHPKAATARIRKGRTILHWAVFFKKVDIAKELVHLMRPKDLEIQDHLGLTALHHVIEGTPESVELAKCMVEKNMKLLSIVLPSGETIPFLAGKITPLIQAHDLSHEEGEKMAQYLYSITPHGTLNESECAMLIIRGLMLKIFEIVWDLIQHRPEVVIAKDFYGRTPLNELAGMRSAFLSGSSLNFWEQWIYGCIQIKPMEESIPTTDDDVCINVQNPENGDQSNKRQRHHICSGTSLFRGLVVKTFGKLMGFSRIYQMKLVHVRILEFLPRMCEVTKNKDVKELQGLEKTIFVAIKKGHVEYITHLCKANYELCYITNEKSRNIFQFAAECRQHKVFSLLYGLGDQRNWGWLFSGKDRSSNNMLHVVGTISSAAQINLIQGATLQMQRELQWFKEVERFAQPVDHEVINKTDEMTPRELFTKGHKDLVREGEREMKDTATTSCAVVGALIVTITFAAAFTIPGGNKQDTVMIFLGILTSRYTEDDFLKSLPTKMILGLITLFLSIVSMMIAFSSALSIMLHGKSCIAILATLLASVPVASFIWMQFPLLRELVISTYGAGVFDRKIKHWPEEDPKYSASC